MGKVSVFLSEREEVGNTVTLGASKKNFRFVSKEYMGSSKKVRWLIAHLKSI